MPKFHETYPPQPFSQDTSGPTLDAVPTYEVYNTRAPSLHDEFHKVFKRFALDYFLVGTGFIGSLIALAWTMWVLPREWGWLTGPAAFTSVLSLCLLWTVIAQYIRSNGYLLDLQSDLFAWQDVLRQVAKYRAMGSVAFRPVEAEPERPIMVYSNGANPKQITDGIVDETLAESVTLTWADVDWFYSEVIRLGTHSKSHWVRGKQHPIVLPVSHLPITYAIYKALLAPLAETQKIVGRTDRISGTLVDRDPAHLSAAARSVRRDGITILSVKDADSAHVPNHL